MQIANANRVKIIKNMLQLAPDLGWNNRNLKQACLNSGFDGEYAEIAFENQIMGASIFLNCLANSMMARNFSLVLQESENIGGKNIEGEAGSHQTLQKSQGSNNIKAEKHTKQQVMKVREKIKTLIMLKFFAYNQLAGAEDGTINEHIHNAIFRAVNGYLLLASNNIQILKLLATTADEIWHQAGDTSTDFNYYSKRMLLAGVYSASFMKWLSDDSEHFIDTQKFVENRIEDVLKIPAVKAKISGKIFQFSSNIPFLRLVR